MTIATTSTYPDDLREAMNSLEIAFPAPGEELEQDEEWVLAKVDGDWRKIRLHNYDEVYAVPGLYEKWVYEVFRCQSPAKIRSLLARAIRQGDGDPSDLTVLDLGAGNGCVADELRRMGVERFVGVDIYEEARDAAERDRPGLYDDFVVADLLDLPADARQTLDEHDFDCLTCVAALGFGDIPPPVFAAAFNRIRSGGWIAFTIKESFLERGDDSGFAGLIRRMLAEGVMELVARDSYRHRISTDGAELIYEAFVARKHADIPSAWTNL